MAARVLVVGGGVVGLSCAWKLAEAGHDVTLVAPDPGRDGASWVAAGMLAGMISSFIGSLILSFVLAHIIFWSGVTTFWNGALMGLVVWCGFVASPGFAQGIYEGRPFKLFAINTGYWLVAILATGGLLAIWH